MVSMAFFAVLSLLGFFSRKIFIDCLGAEVLGLNTTATNILEILNLAELGIGGAVAYFLYKPLHHGDHDTICDIVTLQGHFYRRIALGMIGASVVIMAFFPWIFHKMTLPLWYAYASYAALLFSTFLGYFVNYRQILLTSAQMDYKIRYTHTAWMIVKILCQMAAVKFLPFPYVAWVVLEFLFAIIAARSLHRATVEAFPYLTESKKTFRDLREEYGEILTKVKQIFVHRLTGVATQQTSPLIIYAYISLRMVAVYGNYLILFSSLTRLCGALFTSMSASVGDLVAEGNEAKIRGVFKELFASRFVLCATIIFTILTCCQGLVKLWMGPEYVLPYSTLLIISCTYFITILRGTVDNFLNAYGLYRDVWAAVAEASINIGLSLVLGYFWGLNGILSGVTISLVLIIGIWKPYFLFHSGIKISVWHYFRLLGMLSALAIFVGTAIAWLASLLPFSPGDSWVWLFVCAGCYALLFAVLLTVCTCFFDLGMKQFLLRMKNQVIK